MPSPSELSALIIKFFQEAECHVARGTDGDVLIGFVLHSVNLERLVSNEYVRMGRLGIIVPFLLRPSLEGKCDAVRAGLQEEGFECYALSAERFSVLMPAAGMVKPALYPRTNGFADRLAWVRDAT